MHPTIDSVPDPDRWYCTECGHDTVTQPRERLLGGWVVGYCAWCDRTTTASPIRLSQANTKPKKKKGKHA